MTADEMDDHLPPPVPAGTRVRERKARAPEAAPPRTSPWPDRGLFLVVGLLAGFAAAYLYLDKNPSAVPQASPTDPHAGVVGVGPGATRDLPGSGGGQPSLAADPVARQKLDDLEAAVAKEPKNADLLVQLGNTAYDVEDWQKAVDAYERALRLREADPNVLTDLGVAYRNIGNVDKALAMFTQASAKDPNHWPAQFNLAIVYGIDKGDPKRALEILQKLRKAHPEIPAIDRLADELEQRAKGRPRA